MPGCIHHRTSPCAARPAPNFTLYSWCVVLLASSLACGGDTSRRLARTGIDSAVPAVSFDTAAPATGDSIAPDVRATGDSSADPTLGKTGALEVLRAYFLAIRERRFHDAYELWSDNGAASGLSFEEFARGYDHTRSTSAVIGRPGRIEGAAGSRYIDVPVRIDVVTTDGRLQHYRGRIVLRRAVVPGADSAARHWHLFSAAIDELK